MKLAIVGPSYHLDDRSFDCQRSINWYPLVSESGTSKEISAMRGTPGTGLFAMAGGGPGRGGISTALKRGFVVSGNELYEIFDFGDPVLRGTLRTATGLVSIAENGLNEIGIVDGVSGYIYDQDADTFTEITDPDFPAGCKTITYQDGYFICPKPDSGGYAISAINDGLTWDTLDFGSSEASPDVLIAAISDRRSLYLLGAKTVEIHQNTGNAAFPFERITGAIIPTGLAAWASAQIFDNSLVWLGVDEQGRGVVWRIDGFNAVRISTQAIETRIASAADFSESYAWVYHQKGHIFYCLQIKGLDTTLVYDGSTRQWHERSYRNKVLSRNEQHRGAYHIFFGQKNLIGDRESGAIYELSDAFLSDNGDEIHRKRVAPHIFNEGQEIAHRELLLAFAPGVGTVTGQGQDPHVMLRYSNDGGYTWSHERRVPIGKMGQYKNKARFMRLGQAVDRVYEITITDPVFVQLNGAYLNPPTGVTG